MSMKITISKERQKFTLNKINRLEERMRSNTVVTPRCQMVKKKIEPIMILQNTAASEKIATHLRSKELTSDLPLLLNPGKKLKPDHYLCKNLEKEFNTKSKSAETSLQNVTKKQRRKIKQLNLVLEQKHNVSQQKFLSSTTPYKENSINTIEN